MPNKTMPIKKPKGVSVKDATDFKFASMEIIQEKKGPDALEKEYMELCNKLLSLTSIAHLEHINSRSYARHMALGELYEGLPGLADTLAEIVVLRINEKEGYGDNKLEPCFCYPEYYKGSMDFKEVLCDVCECLSKCYTQAECGAIETIIGDIMKFTKTIGYKLERFY